MSRPKLFSKIKSITGQYSSGFERTIRLRKVADIMSHEVVLLSNVL